MKITLSSVVVNDQARARRFYTEKLGFVVKSDVPAGDAPTQAGPVTVASFDDTCGNWIQLHQAR
jgi:catechol 2,3-dioxygenase-like lactoylglutathione lyase family enzyme